MLFSHGQRDLQLARPPALALLLSGLRGVARRVFAPVRHGQLRMHRKLQQQQQQQQQQQRAARTRLLPSKGALPTASAGRHRAARLLSRAWRVRKHVVPQLQVFGSSNAACAAPPTASALGVVVVDIPYDRDGPGRGRPAAFRSSPHGHCYDRDRKVRGVHLLAQRELAAPPRHVLEQRGHRRQGHGQRQRCLPPGDPRAGRARGAHGAVAGGGRQLRFGPAPVRSPRRDGFRFDRGRRSPSQHQGV
jgi:hypothetical protein